MKYKGMFCFHCLKTLVFFMCSIKELLAPVTFRTLLPCVSIFLLLLFFFQIIV